MESLIHPRSDLLLGVAPGESGNPRLEPCNDALEDGNQASDGSSRHLEDGNFHYLPSFSRNFPLGQRASYPPSIDVFPFLLHPSSLLLNTNIHFPTLIKDLLASSRSCRGPCGDW